MRKRNFVLSIFLAFVMCFISLVNVTASEDSTDSSERFIHIFDAAICEYSTESGECVSHAIQYNRDVTDDIGDIAPLIEGCSHQYFDNVESIFFKEEQSNTIAYCYQRTYTHQMICRDCGYRLGNGQTMHKFYHNWLNLTYDSKQCTKCSMIVYLTF